MIKVAVLIILSLFTLTQSEGIFNCATFGLKSVHGKFLSAQPNGDVEWDRDSYNSYEKISFEQSGENTGYLKSVHGKYLAATNDDKLQWDRTWKRSLEVFTVYQYEDKIALESAHGKYMSAQDDGTVDVDRTDKGSWEWFIVHPQSCLNNIECDCSKEINQNDYDLVGVVYDKTGGAVKAFRPEQVGYQHIDNSDGSTEQSTTFTVSEEVTETASFTHTAGASVTVGTEFSVGIPAIASGSVSVEVSVSYEFSYGTERSETKSMEAQYNCVAPAGKSVSCEALLFKYQLDVPYTQTWQHKRLPCTCQSKGVFREISANEMRLHITED